MSDAREEQILIPSGTGTLSAVLYLPSGTPRGSILFCNPLFEERKSSQRIMVECARTLCSDGLMVLRFDYRGCGDSTGDFEEFTTDDWLCDINIASQYLAKRARTGNPGLLGLRLGMSYNTWEFALYVKNLTDEFKLGMCSPDSSFRLNQPDYSTCGLKPRTVGFSVGKYFN